MTINEAEKITCLYFFLFRCSANAEESQYWKEEQVDLVFNLIANCMHNYIRQVCLGENQ